MPQRNSPGDTPFLPKDEHRVFMDTEAPAGSFIDCYRIDDCVGEGGFGIVFKGVECRTRRIVAIKVSRSQEKTVFQKEVEALEALRSPWVVEYLSSGLSTHGYPFLVTEYIPGRSLEDVLEDFTLPLSDIVHLAHQFSQAIDHLKSKDYFHRDIKPANTVLANWSYWKKGNFNLKLVDFGTARSTAAALTKADAGTVLYRAPEQIDHRPCHASDWWSFGVILHRLCMRRFPFGIRPDMPEDQINSLIRSGTLRMDDESDPLPTMLVELIVGLLARDPNSRWGFAEVSSQLAKLDALQSVPPWRLDHLTAEDFGQCLRVVSDVKALGHNSSDNRTCFLGLFRCALETQEMVGHLQTLLEEIGDCLGQCDADPFDARNIGEKVGDAKMAFQHRAGKLTEVKLASHHFDALETVVWQVKGILDGDEVRVKQITEQLRVRPGDGGVLKAQMKSKLGATKNSLENVFRLATNVAELWNSRLQQALGDSP